MNVEIKHLHCIKVLDIDGSPLSIRVIDDKGNELSCEDVFGSKEEQERIEAIRKSFEA